MVAYSVAYEAGFEDMARRIPDISRINALIGFKPTVTLDEIIMRIADQVRELVFTDERADSGTRLKVAGWEKLAQVKWRNE